MRSTHCIINGVPNNSTVQFCKELAQSLWDEGWDAAHRGDDFDPLAPHSWRQGYQDFVRHNFNMEKRS